MSADDTQPRPGSVLLSKTPSAEGPYCTRRPNLREILANTAPSPWTLAAFMAYLSNNHCLETLEFTMDAGRYKKHYQRMMSKATSPGVPSPQDAEYVKDLWTRLIEAYILPNGSREVNLPSEVRDPIVAIKATSLPPTPESLDPAVAKTFELMEESVLVPFLNSIYPQSLAPSVPTYSYSATSSAPQYEDKSRYSRRSKHASSRSSPPPSGDAITSSAPPHLPNRKSAPSALTTALNKSRLSTRLSPTTSAPAAPYGTVGATSGALENVTSGPGLTDDSGSGSPAHDSPMTPPVTPPIGDLSSSPRTSRDSGTWKKLGRLSGWKPGRKKSQSELQ